MDKEKEFWRSGNNYDSNDRGYNRDNTGRRPYNQNRQGDGYGNYGNRFSNHFEERPNRSYSNERSSYGNRPQKPYDRNERKPYGDNSGYGQQRSYNKDTNKEGNQEVGPVKKKRPRVGESSMGGGLPYGQQKQYDNPPRPYNNNRGGGNYGNRPGGQSGYNRPQQGNNRGVRPRQGGNYNPQAKYGIQKQLKYREEQRDPNEPIRLNKYLANAGVCSRREADEFIQAGVVKVNGVAVTELGTKITYGDKVMFHDQPVRLESKVYILLNKPKNCVTTSDDPQERLTVMDLVKNACRERIFPVGRLDRNTTGVLLLTNDGDLASKLTHPKYLKKKIYHVWLDKPISVDDMQKIVQGIELEDGEIHADAISYANEEDKSQVGIEIHSGRNRIVRRIFETLGYHVVKLDRVYFAGLTKRNLSRGKWRHLTDKEVNMLRMGAFE